MKSNPRIAAAALSLALSLVAPAAAFAQEKQKDDGRAAGGRQTPRAGERLEPDDKSVARPGVPEEALANRRDRIDEDAAVELPYYNNFLTSYPLGPEDVISVRLFGTGLERYNLTGITVPPDGRINYHFIRDGLHVAGKTTQQVADEIAHHLDEYIIDPKVTVSLEKAVSMRYGVIGDVAQPGVRQMTRRLSVLEALNEAGGVLGTGNKKKVVVLHWDADRMIKQIPIDVSAIERGRAADNYFLSPGDQIFVPGNRWKTVDKIIKALPVISFARIFTGGF
ncbi:MAG TPA: polysaccharide biosynthesis/export family protein [Pyrinomonadaceae bacterium]|jgi:protein involved in polysaccharide export with SLBB domain